jgi:hypothetical protein
VIEFAAKRRVRQIEPLFAPLFFIGGNFSRSGSQRKFMFQAIIKQNTILIFLFLTVFNFASAARAQICQPATGGLVSWYRAEGDATDAQGQNSGVLQNGTTFAPGRIAQGFKFDGVDDYVEIPDAASLKPQNVTLEAWVKFDSLSSPGTGSAPPGFQYIVFKKNGRQQDLFEGYSLIKLPDNRLVYSSSSNSGVQTTVVDNTQTVEVGKYYHVVGTYDGTTARLYVNGRKVGEQIHGLPLDYGTRPVVIGGTNETNWDGRMNGVIDEVMIYNRALSDLDVQTNFLNGLCRSAAVVPNDLISWHGGDGDTRDFQNSNNATFAGFPNYVVGKVGQAFRFDGQSSYVQINSSGIFRGQAEGTIQTWVRPRGFPTGQFNNSAIWTEGEEVSTSTRFGIYYGINGELGAYSNASTVNAVSPSAVPQNEWTHVAATFKAGETVKLYINGTLAATSPNLSGTLSDAPSGFVGIGGFPTGFGDNFLLNGDVDDASVYTRALSGAEIQSIFNAGTAGKLRQVATNAGANVAVTLRDATVTFSSVTTAGATAQTPLEVSALPALPQGYAQTGLAYDISTTAAVSGNIDLCFNLPALSAQSFARLRVLHLENGVWVDRTISVNSPQLCGRAASLSPFVIAENLQPTAAAVTVGGRVTNGKSGVYRAQITLTDATGATRSATTNQFGYYRFTNVAAGATYFLTARAKQYVFTPETMVLSVSDELLDADFEAQER